MQTARILEETLLRVRDSKSPTVCQLRYWIRVGLMSPKGTRKTLEWCKQGEFVFTSKEAILRFLKEMN